MAIDQHSDDLFERFSMGRLQRAELVDFVTHLLQCTECQNGVARIDLFLAALAAPAQRPLLRDTPRPRMCPLSGFGRECFLVQVALPNKGIHNIGVLLHDNHTDRLFCRFRRDFESFAGDDALWLDQLEGFFSANGNEAGGRKCLACCRTTFAGILRISRSRRIRIRDYGATTVEGLYAKYVKVNVVPFRTHLPQYDLEAAAGKFGRQMVVAPEGWVEVRTDIPLTEAMFVIHVNGHSMEPQIPDDSLCAFRSRIAGGAAGKILLIEHVEAGAAGSRYTVKLCRVSEATDPNQRGDGAWLHERMTLESLNPGFEPWDVASADQIRVLGEFLFVV